MKTKKVNRYWCDHCNKAGLQSRAMVVHEKHCTMNPARECRVCKLLENDVPEGFERKTLAELMAILPTMIEWSLGPEYRAFEQSVTDAVALLRVATGGCPACMMAALRQKGIPVPMAEGFDFKAEMKVIFDNINEDRRQDWDY